MKDLTPKLYLQILGILLIGLSLSVAASDNNTTTSQSVDMPKPDLTTPENALRSYWAIKQWEDKTIAYEQRRLGLHSLVATRPLFVSVSTGDMRKYFEAFQPSSFEVLERSIRSLKPETDTRVIAIVNIKNITPVPDGARPSAREIKVRERGCDFKYVLVREDGSWKIAEVWRLEPAESYMPMRRLYEPLPPLYPSTVYFD
ncbi:MAG: hypothetical protein EPO06_01815 [Burkholderiaceae bacterium]|nr:MAG: hypothetical protein EPO06_01815 [Burkholderiaceae bacterium]